VARPALSPEAGPATQALVATPPANLSPNQAAWLQFVAEVERGERVDPLGQYVRKTNQIKRGDGQQAQRPKFEMSARQFRWVTRPSGGGRTTKGLVVSAATADCDPLAILCEGDGGGGGPTITSTFTSSVNQGGGGNIRDLKLILGTPQDNTVSAQRVSGAGYIKLDADLNKGCGGSYIYLCFTRNISTVLSGLESSQVKPYSSPADIVSSLDTKHGSFTSTPQPNLDYFEIWLPNQNENYDWSELDLNKGAGGEYLYSYQSKTPFSRLPNGAGTRPRAAFLEIGVLSGNSSTITPPAGWQKHNQDLNEGAGGDFIYFCYKL